MRRASRPSAWRFSDATSACPVADDPLRRPAAARPRRHLRRADAACATRIRGSTRRPVDFDAVAAVVRRWIEAHTFAPRTGEAASTSSMPPARGSATSTPCSWRAWSTASGRTRRAATSSIRPRCCATSAGRRSPSGSTACARRSATCCACRRRAWCVSTFTLEDDAIVAASTPARRGADGRFARAWRQQRRPQRRGSSTTKHWRWSRRDRCAGDPTARAAAARRIDGRRDRRSGMTTGHDAVALFAERARALSGLPVQVLRRRRPAARGAARGRADAVAAGAGPVHPRGLSALLRGVGCAR